MAYITRLTQYYLKLASVGLLGLLLTNGTVLSAGFKPIFTLWPNSYLEINAQYNKSDLGSVAIPLSGQITPSGLNGLWLTSHLGYTAWNWLASFKGEAPFRLNPEGSIGISYYHSVQSQLQVQTYGTYHWSKGREMIEPEPLWHPSRHVGRLGVMSQSLKTRQFANLNAHILWPNQEQAIPSRQDQWRVDFIVGSPIPFIFENTFLLGGPYYKRIRTIGIETNYWGVSGEVMMPLFNGSAFAKCSYDQYDGRRIVFGWFKGMRAITPLTPENFM